VCEGGGGGQHKPVVSVMAVAVAHRLAHDTHLGLRFERRNAVSFVSAHLDRQPVERRVCLAHSRVGNHDGVGPKLGSKARGKNLLKPVCLFGWLFCLAVRLFCFECLLVFSHHLLGLLCGRVNPVTQTPKSKRKTAKLTWRAGQPSLPPSPLCHPRRRQTVCQGASAQRISTAQM
jgi:hypothetical protein